MVTDRYHTRLVRGARVVLPVAAIGLLSTLFLLARSVNPDDAIPFAEVDVSMRARDQQLTMPRFAGVSRDGTEFAMTADLARPDADDPRRMTAQAVMLTLRDTSEATAQMTADTAEVDTAARQLTLEGDVRIETSTDYRLLTTRLQGTLGSLNIRATEGVTGDGPLGTLRAGAMYLNEDEDGAQRLLFTGGVDLLYVPPTE
ncbi:LPS export ABC transporter periplasmic protein LptC [Jannaschia sp. 2305UL9-9]|uniref:LPS export ABC transporter periplasmic protein LptC n=1 Tax=Jannaschia sp. 2305UL9-9 TaxID=3121638 RepID=UPI003527BCE9